MGWVDSPRTRCECCRYTAGGSVGKKGREKDSCNVKKRVVTLLITLGMICHASHMAHSTLLSTW